MKEKPIDFLGKWRVDKIERNGQPIDENAWMTDNDAWKYIYIEAHGQMFYRPIRFFEPSRAKHASFKYDDKTHELKLKIVKQGKPVDSMMISITKKSKQAMEWVGASASNSFKIQLKKPKCLCIEQFYIFKNRSLIN